MSECTEKRTTTNSTGCVQISLAVELNHRIIKIMLKSLMYIRTYKRIILLLAFFLVYISMYLIHNAYGTLCIIKQPPNNSSNSPLFTDKSSNINSNAEARVFEVSHFMLYRVKTTLNLFSLVSCVVAWKVVNVQTLKTIVSSSWQQLPYGFLQMKSLKSQ